MCKVQLNRFFSVIPFFKYYDLSFHTHTQKTAILIYDSIGEHVKHIPNCQYFLQVYPGTRIEDLDYFISPGITLKNRLSWTLHKIAVFCVCV
jgi:hypothetical protein